MNESVRSCTRPSADSVPHYYHPDTVLVGARTLQIERDRFVMGYAVVSQAQDRIAADGRGTLVSFDYNTRTKTTLPESVRVAIEALEGA